MPNHSGPKIRLDGKVAIVTGASRGIGKGLAIGLAAAGARVVCAARTIDHNPEGLPGNIHETAEAIRSIGGDALPIRCDIGDESDISNLIQTTLETYGRIDVLMNNAMASTRGLFEKTTHEMWDLSMRINVRSLFTTCQHVIPLMKKQGAGSIINMSSGAAGHTISGMPPGYLTYSVAKAAMERFSTALALEVAEAGIAVNALRPGAVKTETSVHELGEDYDWSDWKTPESVVPSVVYLAAQNGSGMTGRIVDAREFGGSWP
ncbi:SDR family NAD(P)-dependent oxidoreductase [Myxococcota bacterium]|nr:SDR family NAD(P)-dependent oxidoreductase [Myxococcota bacterium]